jgi:hypothetical protein
MHIWMGKRKIKRKILPFSNHRPPRLHSIQPGCAASSTRSVSRTATANQRVVASAIPTANIFVYLLLSNNSIHSNVNSATPT